MPEDDRDALSLALDWSAYDHYGDGDAYAKLPAQGAGWGKASAVCIGNRECQRDGAGVMCPSYRVTRDTAHSTGHRAATLKAALDGELGAPTSAALGHPALAEAMDLCVSCKGCKRDCPNGVDMALLRTEYLAQRWRHLPPPRRERLFAGWPQWAHRLRQRPLLLRAWAHLQAAAPALVRHVQARLGLAPQRSLPVLAPHTALARWPTAGATPAAPADSAPREVVLWVDTFTNQLDPHIGVDAAAVLEAMGCRVQVLRPVGADAPLCCGRTAFSGGFVEEARAQARRTVEALAPFVSRGVPVIGLEPSCLLMFRDEYLVLGLGDAALALSKQAWLLEEFLAREVDAKRLEKPAFRAQDLDVLVHGHCHAKAFGAMKALRKVLGWVPGLRAQVIDASCCGMAGAFGLEAEHHEVSMRMGELALLPAVRAASPDTVVMANGTSCRHQIRDGAAREARHLASVLRSALAEGSSA